MGIDIGETALRIAALEFRGGADPRSGATLNALIERPVPAGVIRAGEIEEPATFSVLLKDAYGALKLKPRSVVAAVGHPSVMMREVTVPSQQMDKVRSSLAFHVSDSLPMAIEDAQLDFFPTAEFESDQGPMLRGMLAAAPREVVRDLIAGLDGARLQPQIIDHKAFGLWRTACTAELMSEVIAIVDVGAATTTVIISQAGSVRLVRVLGSGGAQATAAVQSAYKGSAVDAEDLKRKAGMSPSPVPEYKAAADAVNQAMTPLIESIRNTLVYFASSNPGGAVQRMILSGGAAYLHGFGQTLSSATRLPIALSDPFAVLTLGKRVNAESIAGREAEFATVIGLAMGGAA
ncbi:type IV pilus assembly protein PilM [Demequina sp. NBRC 110055]|uniref:type IV pilus assembly protein PilM n=1 Tax=Demequina sp. NBRC 110055 TaxID=1570344 RepID=UPI0013564B69|nr:type IV pilus assembly protein PilM [Demequina sp. NBRC 110055]